MFIPHFYIIFSDLKCSPSLISMPSWRFLHTVCFSSCFIRLYHDHNNSKHWIKARGEKSILLAFLSVFLIWHKHMSWWLCFCRGRFSCGSWQNCQTTGPLATPAHVGFLDHLNHFYMNHDVIGRFSFSAPFLDALSWIFGLLLINSCCLPHITMFYLIVLFKRWGAFFKWFLTVVLLNQFFNFWFHFWCIQADFLSIKFFLLFSPARHIILVDCLWWHLKRAVADQSKTYL